MTGTSGDMDAIHLWRSVDGKRFSYVQAVFRLDQGQAAGRLLWAPEIHYLNGTYYIAWCVNLKLGMGLLKSGLTVDGEQVGYEGIFLRKIGKWYVALAAEWNGGGNREDGTYDMMYSVSRNLAGPYTRRRVGVPHAGHSTMFQDREGKWHLAFFGNDRTAPFRAMPGIVRLDVRDTGDDLAIAPEVE